MSEKILQAYSSIRNANFVEAKKILSSALVFELNNDELLFAMNCCDFWIDVIARAEGIGDNFERGEAFVDEWKSFQDFLRRKGKIFERTLFAVKAGIFSLALRHYNQAEERDISRKAEIQRRIGLCYKKLGEYETALLCLKEALSLKNDSAAIIAEAADCYALCAKPREAKILFREAFFVDAQKIELDFLDSEEINCLVKIVEEKGRSGLELLEWIPVYGQLYGIFNVKRNLTQPEVAHLNRKIYAVETEMKNPSCQSGILTPRLINMYFWMIDFYVSVGKKDKEKNELLVRMKILDTEIYELYVK